MPAKKIINDEFTHLEGEVSRQRIWQLRMARDHRCIICAQPAIPGLIGTQFCDKHLKRARINSRRATGSRPWKLGSVGKVPREQAAKYVVDGVQLTPRAVQVKTMLDAGMTVKAIAAKLDLHLSQIYILRQKLRDKLNKPYR